MELPSALLLALRSKQDLIQREKPPHPNLGSEKRAQPSLDHWIELATAEKALLALLPTSRMVPTTSTRITASITAYSAMS